MRFEHENGPGTVVMIGNRRWDMPCNEDDPDLIALLTKHPGVNPAPKYKPPAKAAPEKAAPEAAAPEKEV